MYSVFFGWVLAAMSYCAVVVLNLAFIVYIIIKNTTFV